jgi:hypothetical protein
LSRADSVIKADRIGKVADPALNLERVAQRVEAGDFGSPFGRLGQAQQHQNRCRLTRSVRSQDDDYLAGSDLEIDVIDGDGRAVAFGEPLGSYHDLCSHAILPYRRWAARIYSNSLARR